MSAPLRNDVFDASDEYWRQSGDVGRHQTQVHSATRQPLSCVNRTILADGKLPMPPNRTNPDAEAPTTNPSQTVALVSCVAQKLDHPAKARDLYTSPQFVGLRRYAETQADAWATDCSLNDRDSVLLGRGEMGVGVENGSEGRVRIKADKTSAGAGISLRNAGSSNARGAT